MIVKQMPIGTVMETNSYFYIDEKTKHGFLIDPADEPKKLLEVITENGWTIEKMLITHGHFDHIGAVQKIYDELKIPYFAHENSAEYLSNSQMNLSQFFCGYDMLLQEAEYFSDDDFISLKANPEVKLQVIHTPGHTQDSVIFYDEKNNLAFVGDTIFKDTHGRTDFPGGSLKQLKESIRNKILTLPDDTILYSAHTGPTTVAAERKYY